MRKNRPAFAARFSFIGILLLLEGSVSARQSKEPADFLAVWAGMLPIILAAPHGGKSALSGVSRRRGVGMAQFAAERDNNTAELAEAVAVKIDERLGAKPFLVVAHFERKYLDVNRPAPCAFESAAAKPHYDAYQEAIEAAAERIRNRWGLGLLLDIHGQGADPDATSRGTNNGKSVAALRQRHVKAALSGTDSILGQLASKGYKIIPDTAAMNGSAVIPADTRHSLTAAIAVRTSTQASSMSAAIRARGKIWRARPTTSPRPLQTSRTPS